MRRWSEVAERVSSTTRTSEKTRLLADEFRSPPAEELPVAAIFWTGRPFPEADGRSPGLGWAAIAAAVTKVAGVSREALGEAYDRHSDLGKAVADVMAAQPDRVEATDEPTLTEVAQAFAEVEQASGPAAKAARFEALLRRCDPLTAKYVVKVLGGRPADRAARGAPGGGPRRGVRATARPGEAGRPARRGRRHRRPPRPRRPAGRGRAAAFHPLKFMLASPAEDAAEIMGRLGPTVWVEDKYDGIRAQLHRRGTEVRLYSRDLNEISDGYPEVVAGRARPRLGRDPRRRAAASWDGDGGTVLPFLALQARLGRKRPTAAILA